MQGGPGAGKLRFNIAQREAKAFFVANSIRFLPGQSRLLRRICACGIFLLCFHGLAFPAAGHGFILVFLDIPGEIGKLAFGNSSKHGSIFAAKSVTKNELQKDKRIPLAFLCL